MKLYNLGRIAHAEPSMKIGLLGGSFDPPHEGHMVISEIALQKANLNQVWWILSPGNPLKDSSKLTSIKKRYTACTKISANPKISITAFEALLGIHYSQKTLDYLITVYPKLNFIFLMGADNFAIFHKWKNWQRIALMVPIIVFDRPGFTFASFNSPAAIALRRSRIDERDAEQITKCKLPAWTFIHGSKNDISSSFMRSQCSTQGATFCPN